MNDQTPAEETLSQPSETLQTRFHRNYKNYVLNFLTLASSILMVVSLIGLLPRYRPDPSGRIYGPPLAGLASLMLVASILLQRKALKQHDEKAFNEVPRKVPWGASQSLVMLLLAIFLPVALGLLVAILSLFLSMAVNDLLLLVTGKVAIVIPVMLYMINKKMSIEFLGLDSRSALQEFKLALMILPLAVLTGLLAGIIVQTLIPIPPWFEEIFQIFSPSSFIDLVGLSLIMIFVIAPCEEVLFRGFVQRGLESNLGSTRGILLSSILFGVFHLNPWQFLPAFLLGILLGYVFKKRRYRLWCPIALHAAYNVTLLVLVYALLF